MYFEREFNGEVVDVIKFEDHCAIVEFEESTGKTLHHLSEAFYFSTKTILHEQYVSNST